MVQNSGNSTQPGLNPNCERSNVIQPTCFTGFPAPQFRQPATSDVEKPTSELVWFPQGLPTGKSVCIASSRLGRNLDEQDEWFDALRTLALRLDPQHHFLVTSAGTTTDIYVRHLCRRFGFSVVELFPWTEKTSRHLAQQQQGLKQLGEPELPSVRSSPLESNMFPAYYLPMHSHITEDSTDPLVLTGCLSDIMADHPFDRDSTLIRIAAECYLLSIRPQGNIHRATIDRIADSIHSDPDHARTWVVLSKKTKTSPVHRQLLEAGAVGWWLYNEASDATSEGLTSSINLKTATEPAAFSPPILDLAEFPSENFLIHWTRDRSGPWPHQTDEEWLDDLIFQSERRKHGATFALRRILATRQILASRKMTRDEQPVVCLSNRDLRELGELTVYRQHLGRWDFVPYGIAVDREWLANQGARPVIYGEPETWQSLPETDRPFFQLAQSKSGRIDWTAEKEWRWLGNLNLRQMPQQAVAVFVPTIEDAHVVAPYCSWPIVVLGIKPHGRW